jgi:Pyruvate/2-oxoacid:ferredoxin oxidoreductase delta subunit
MQNTIYAQLAQVLDTLPNGFPATDSGVEIQLLAKIFRPEDAELFCDLRLDYETAQQISERTGRSMEGLEDHLEEMQARGQIFMLNLEGTKFFKMLPWVFGIYEFQLPRLDREMAQLCDDYMTTFADQFFRMKPQLMQVLPVEKKIASQQLALPYEHVSHIIENSQSFAVFDCICKKEKRLLDAGCDKPLEICTAYAPVPGVFDNSDYYRAISKEEAYALLEKAEEAALVHLTGNVQNGQYYICNCCGCCCNVLKAINQMGIDASQVINAYYYALIDAEACIGCGTCKDERCQVNAIVEDDDVYRIVREKCIGCGLCVDTCPGEAIVLHRKEQAAVEPPPQDEMDWFEKRGLARDVDFSRFK